MNAAVVVAVVVVAGDAADADAVGRHSRRRYEHVRRGRQRPRPGRLPPRRHRCGRSRRSCSCTRTPTKSTGRVAMLRWRRDVLLVTVSAI